MGLARGPVDDAIIEMIVVNAPAKVYRTAGVVVAEDDDPIDVPPPPPADDPEAALEQAEVPGFVTPEQIRKIKALPKEEQKRAIQPAVKAPKRQLLQRPATGTPRGTDEDLKDAASGGKVLRLD